MLMICVRCRDIKNDPGLSTKYLQGYHFRPFPVAVAVAVAIAVAVADLSGDGYRLLS